MAGYPVRRARSYAVADSRSIERYGTPVSTLTRVSSVPNITSLRVGDDKYRQSTMFRYRRDYDLLDDQWHDRGVFYQPFYWNTYRYAARRQNLTDPIPNPWHWEYPQFWSRYKWYTDWLNPTYWRRHRDPNYDRPLWNSCRPWAYDNKNRGMALRMYRQGLLDFKTLDEKFLTPNALDRTSKDWSDVYLPAGRYGAHRYFYSWNN